jgi:hypothetical protein
MNTIHFLSRDEAAHYLASRGLRISKKTLAKYAVTGGGPSYRTFGSRRAVYDPADLETWISEKLTKLRRSTSEMRPAAA